jgi:hypothetical protein
VKSLPISSTEYISAGAPYYLTRTLVKLNAKIKITRIVYWTDKDKEGIPLGIRYFVSLDDPAVVEFSGQADPSMGFKFEPTSLQSFTVETHGGVQLTSDQRVKSVNLTFTDKTGQIIRDLTQTAVNVAMMVAAAGATNEGAPPIPKFQEVKEIGVYDFSVGPFDPLEVGQKQDYAWSVSLNDFNERIERKINAVAMLDNPYSEIAPTVSKIKFLMTFKPQGTLMMDTVMVDAGKNHQAVSAQKAAANERQTVVSPAPTQSNASPSSLQLTGGLSLVNLTANTSEDLYKDWINTKRKKLKAIDGLVFRTPVPARITITAKVDEEPNVIYDVPQLFAQLGPVSVYQLKSSLFVDKKLGLSFNEVTGALESVNLDATSRGAEMAATAKDSTDVVKQFIGDFTKLLNSASAASGAASAASKAVK